MGFRHCWQGRLGVALQGPAVRHVRSDPDSSPAPRQAPPRVILRAPGRAGERQPPALCRTEARPGGRDPRGDWQRRRESGAGERDEPPPCRPRPPPAEPGLTCRGALGAPPGAGLQRSEGGADALAGGLRPGAPQSRGGGQQRAEAQSRSAAAHLGRRARIPGRAAAARRGRAAPPAPASAGSPKRSARAAPQKEQPAPR